MADEPTVPMVPRLPDTDVDPQDAAYIYRPSEPGRFPTYAEIYGSDPPQSVAGKNPDLLLAVLRNSQLIAGFNPADLNQHFGFQFNGFNRTAILTGCHSFCSLDEANNPVQLTITLDFKACPDA